MVKSVIGQIPTGEDCYGRDAEIAEAWNKVERGESLLLLAPRRSGKSAIMQAMHDQPRSGWAVVFENVESLDSAQGVVARMLQALLAIPAYQTGLESTALGRRFKQFMDRALDKKGGSGDSPAQIMLNALGREWDAGLTDIRDRIANTPEAPNVLMILDELPIVAAKLANGDDSDKRELEALMNGLRALCLHTQMHGRFALVVGGSIGLANVLDRAGLRAVDNHLADVYVAPWDRQTAQDFVAAWAEGEKQPVCDEAREAMLDALGTVYIPSHVQQALDELRKRVSLAEAGAKEVRAAFDKHVLDRTSRSLLKNYETRLKEILTETDMAGALTILHEVSAYEDGIAVADIVGQGVDDDRFDYILDILEQDGYVAIDDDGYLTFPARLIRLYFKRRAKRRRRASA
jgi:hypothetical protein